MNPASTAESSLVVPFLGQRALEGIRGEIGGLWGREHGPRPDLDR